MKAALVAVAGAALLVLAALAVNRPQQQGSWRSWRGRSMPGLTSNFFQGATVLYTAAHLDVAPFQRVWNPDTNNDYTAKEFAEEDHSQDPPVDMLCGTMGDNCPEVAPFNGEDYFEAGKPIGCCYTPQQQAVWAKWNSLATRVAKLEGTLAFLREMKATTEVRWKAKRNGSKASMLRGRVEAAPRAAPPARGFGVPLPL